jgi:hypothetical protein
VSYDAEGEVELDLEKVNYESLMIVSTRHTHRLLLFRRLHALTLQTVIQACKLGCRIVAGEPGLGGGGSLSQRECTIVSMRGC